MRQHPALFLFAVLLLSLPGLARQGAAAGEPVVVLTTSLSKAYVGQQYEAQLSATGGILPLRWQLRSGSLPQGMELHPEGMLVGVPHESGTFHFTLTVTDSGKPAYQKNQEMTLEVFAPLLLRWGKYPSVNGKVLAGSVLISNQTDKSFDLTFIAVAVDANGRATALGYQHAPIDANTLSLEIPFGETLPPGSYAIDVDAVGETGTSTIFRARLAPTERAVVTGQP